jgi:hypothetical protein
LVEPRGFSSTHKIHSFVSIHITPKRITKSKPEPNQMSKIGRSNKRKKIITLKVIKFQENMQTKTWGFMLWWKNIITLINHTA